MGQVSRFCFCWNGGAGGAAGVDGFLDCIERRALSIVSDAEDDDDGGSVAGEDVEGEVIGETSDESVYDGHFFIRQGGQHDDEDGQCDGQDYWRS